MSLRLSNSIPDRFREGPGQVDVNVKGPGAAVKDIVDQGAHREEISKLTALSAVYGLHAPHRLFLERQLVSHQRRLPGSGLSSSMLSLELLMGTEDKLPFGEFAYSKLELNQTSFVRSAQSY
eukprot:Gregarina_sp_Poly_1__4400@NODE_2377_length_2209_cov_421_009337_g1494_i1_p4_GENE_NODE_2377_length_2209_cov_421_009337_g1494_i1NODE_2377_length_2209_cov_421_009337_g1494_i1_p4_ORF_typecomplete_len122_score8_84UMP1/PF05348_11/1_9e13_NODE_2377_length_2209_cov_421_009337_g1494_i152417